MKLRQTLRYASQPLLQLQKLRRLLAFARHEGGNVALTFGLTIVPILGLVGAAVDYSRANNARSAMQAALDSTSLMISKDASTLTAAQLTTKAQAYFSALYNHPETTTPTITATYSATSSIGSKVVVTASSTMSTNFMKVVGYPTLPISSSSTAAWGNTRLRVAMVLDNTGSMADDGKISALQTASTNLITQLSAAAQNPGDVYISIVPFAKDVNVGASNYNQSWVDFTSWDASNQSCSWGWGGNNCTTPNHNTWNGCIMDRTQSYDTLNTAPTTSNISTLFPAEQYNACPVSIMPLSYDWTSLKAKIAAMSPNGGTNQAIGLALGWQTLAQTSPYNAPALDPNYQYNTAIILLSDGLNTQDRWYGNGSSWSSQVDARQKILCDNVKAAGITIYTIQVNTGGDPTSSVLQYCASGSNNFYMLTQASQVISTFNAIGSSLAKLRIAY